MINKNKKIFYLNAKTETLLQIFRILHKSELGQIQSCRQNTPHILSPRWEAHADGHCCQIGERD